MLPLDTFLKRKFLKKKNISTSNMWHFVSLFESLNFYLLIKVNSSSLSLWTNFDISKLLKSKLHSKGAFKYYVSAFGGLVWTKMLTLLMLGRGWGVSDKMLTLGGWRRGKVGAQSRNQKKIDFFLNPGLFPSQRDQRPH